MQIGEVADRTGLSLRTIRHYEEVGLLPAAERSPGGFRLYGEEAVERLLLIRQMKPLDFTLEQMRELIEVRDVLQRPGGPQRARADATARLDHYRELVTARLAKLETVVRNAHAFAEQLDDELQRASSG